MISLMNTRTFPQRIEQSGAQSTLFFATGILNTPLLVITIVEIMPKYKISFFLAQAFVQWRWLIDSAHRIPSFTPAKYRLAKDTIAVHKYFVFRLIRTSGLYLTGKRLPIRQLNIAPKTRNTQI